MALMLLLILIQIGAIIALAVIMIQAWWPFVIEFALIHVIVFMLVINRKGTADMKMPWVIVVLALPLVGSLLYAFFANHGLKPKYKKIVKSVNKLSLEYFPQDSLDLELLKKSNNPYKTPFKYLAHNMKSTPTYGNKFSYYKICEEWFPHFKKK